MKYRKSFILLSIVVSGFIVTIGLHAEDSSSAIDKVAIDTFLTKTARSYKIPGLVVAFVDDKGITYEYAYGRLSTGHTISLDTPFILGSSSKIFTALAVMRLVETGQVGLDDPIRQYLPEFTVATPGFADKITVRHLLNNTSGLAGQGLPEPNLGKNSLDEELISLRRCKPVAEPGEKFIYFTPNYRLLALLIERVSGIKSGDFIQKEIFAPLSMTSTYAGPIGVEGLAEGHGEIFGFPFRRVQKYRAGAQLSGFIVSCASDIARFLRSELRAGQGQPGALNPETVRSTWLPPKNAEESYAMGWLAVRQGDNRFLIHGGSLESYESFICIDPGRNRGFVMLMNQGGILPMFGGFNTIRNGLVKVMNDEQPQDGPGTWPVMVISGIFFLIFAIEVYLTIRLKQWRARLGQKPRWRRWINAGFELLFSSFLLFGLIPVMNMIPGDKADWPWIYNMLPELYYALCLMIVLGFARGSCKAWMLLRRGAKLAQAA